MCRNHNEDCAVLGQEYSSWVSKIYFVTPVTKMKDPRILPDEFEWETIDN